MALIVLIRPDDLCGGCSESFQFLVADHAGYRRNPLLSKDAICCWQRLACSLGTMLTRELVFGVCIAAEVSVMAYLMVSSLMYPVHGGPRLDLGRIVCASDRPLAGAGAKPLPLHPQSHQKPSTPSMDPTIGWLSGVMS